MWRPKLLAPQDNTNAQLEGRNVQSAENGVKMLPVQQKINHIQDEATSSAEDDEWSPDTIHSKNQKIHSMRSMNSNGPEFFTLSALVNNRPKKFIIESGSPVTLISKSLFNNTTPLHPLETEYKK